MTKLIQVHYFFKSNLRRCYLGSVDWGLVPAAATATFTDSAPPSDTTVGRQVLRTLAGLQIKQPSGIHQTWKSFFNRVVHRSRDAQKGKYKSQYPEPSTQYPAINL